MPGQASSFLSKANTFLTHHPVVGIASVIVTTATVAATATGVVYQKNVDAVQIMREADKRYFEASEMKKDAELTNIKKDLDSARARIEISIKHETGVVDLKNILALETELNSQYRIFRKLGFAVGSPADGSWEWKESTELELLNQSKVPQDETDAAEKRYEDIARNIKALTYESKHSIQTVDGEEVIPRVYFERLSWGEANDIVNIQVDIDRKLAKKFEDWAIHLNDEKNTGIASILEMRLDGSDVATVLKNSSPPPAGQINAYNIDVTHVPAETWVALMLSCHRQGKNYRHLLELVRAKISAQIATEIEDQLHAAITAESTRKDPFAEQYQSITERDLLLAKLLYHQDNALRRNFGRRQNEDE